MSNYDNQSKSQILLETGTNEFEIVEFSIGNTTYGINVAKVREVINLVDITQIPSAHPYLVSGLFFISCSLSLLMGILFVYPFVLTQKYYFFAVIAGISLL